MMRATDSGEKINWTNRDTECVAELMRNEDGEDRPRLWEGLAAECSEILAPDEVLASLAQMLRIMICGQPGMCTDGVYRENADQPKDYADFAAITGVNYDRVDWDQLARWLLARLARRG